jgi:hypothetical protein
VRLRLSMILFSSLLRVCCSNSTTQPSPNGVRRTNQWFLRKRSLGVGDDAYLTSSRVGGALYALKGNAYVRISIGGPSNQATKMNRSKALAQKALARL